MQKVDFNELRRLHEAATKGMNWQDAAVFDVACRNHLPDLLDELEAAREENASLKQDLDGFKPVGGDFIRAAKLIGAAEELERLNAEFEAIGFSGLRGFTERAAKLRQEAEGK